MSYIDLFKHKQIGEISEIAVYMALEDINGDEFNAKKNQIIIGGGGGEHPAIVVKDLNHSVIVYLMDLYENQEEISDYIHDYCWNNKIDFKSFENFKMFDWGINTYYNFYNYMVEIGYTKDYGYVESFLDSQLGKIIYEKYPELISEEYQKLIQNLKI